MDKKVIFEALKEPMRLLVLAVVSLAITYLSDLDAQWAVAGTFALRFVDSTLHEMGKERSTKTQESPLVKGLTRF
jgi:hypothetical protein